MKSFLISINSILISFKRSEKILLLLNRITSFLYFRRSQRTFGPSARDVTVTDRLEHITVQYVTVAFVRWIITVLGQLLVSFKHVEVRILYFQDQQLCRRTESEIFYSIPLLYRSVYKVSFNFYQFKNDLMVMQESCVFIHLA